jgi:hypothetical protein
MAIEPLIPFKDIRAAWNIADNAPIHPALERFGIRPIELNSRVKALRLSDYALLLEKAQEASHA